MGSREKEKKHKKEKHKKGGKERKHKKEKRGRHERKRCRSGSRSSSSSGGGGSSGDERLDVNQRLAMGRAAARATREILAYKPELARELRELVRQLDGGGALEVGGIPDPFLVSRLRTLFDNLTQLRRNSAGQYFKRRGADTVLSFVAPLLEEGPEALAPYAQAAARFAQEQAAAEAAAAAAAQAAEQQVAAQQQQQQQQQDGGGHVAAGPQIGPAAGPRPQQAEEAEGLVESDGSDEELPAAQIGPVSGPIGPAAGPPGAEVAEEEEEEDAAAGQRMAGPAMPPAEWLAAAAQMEYPVSGDEGEEAGEEEGEEDFMVGPPPPEFAEELDLASMDERSAEVARVLRVLAAHAAEHARASAAEAQERPVDAYEVLGVELDAPAGEVRKRYWRLSLLIHPDKCDHPRAHDAFQAVTSAAKELQDAALRSKVDERRREAQLRREFEAEAAVAERERQWRIARGEATAADLAGPAPPPGQAAARETWMTELPPERRAAAAAAMPTGPFQGFSAKGVKSRGDTSGWTMTPQQRAAAAQQALEGGDGAGAAGGPLLLTGAGGADAGVAAANPAQAARMAAAVDAYNAGSRAKSLMELHAEKQAAEQRKQKKRKKGGKGEGGGAAAAADALGYDPAQHPWRPFDREKDLGPGLSAKAKAEDLLKAQRSLGSKFAGSQGGGRTFL